MRATCMIAFLFLAVHGQAISADFESARAATIAIKARFENPNTGEIFEASGTGVLISREGHVLTSKHVVQLEGAQASQIAGATGSREAAFEALEQIESHVAADVALLKFKNTFNKRDFVVVGQPSSTNVDDEIFYCGPAGNEEWVFTRGRVVGKNGPGGSWNVNLAFGPSSSGGPVMNERGELVAIAWGGIPDGKIVGVNRVLPVSLFENLLAVAGARVDRGGAGVFEKDGSGSAERSMDDPIGRSLIIEEIVDIYKMVGWKLAFFNDWGQGGTRKTLRIHKKSLIGTSADGRVVSTSVDPELFPNSVHYAASVGKRSILLQDEAIAVARFFSAYELFKRSLKNLSSGNADFNTAFIDATSQAHQTMVRGREALCTMEQQLPRLFPDYPAREPVPPFCKSPFSAGPSPLIRPSPI